MSIVSGMNTQSIANEICDQADEFLAGVPKREDARAGIAEYLTIHHASLAPDEKRAIADQAMQILDEEGFFEAPAGGDGRADLTFADE